jgi:3-methylcrotonyl-CoA carboxylase alpha subunit
MPIEVSFRFDDGQFIAQYLDQNMTIHGELSDPHHATVKINQQQYHVDFSATDQTITLYQQGASWVFHHPQASYGQDDQSHDEASLNAPMPGAITQVLVSTHQAVKKDEPLLTLEAMKIEYTIRAPQDGIVIESYFQVGDQVKPGDTLVEFQATEVALHE